MPVADSVAQGVGEYFTRDTLRQQYNKLANAVSYFALNGVMSTTTATLPQVGIATTATQVRTGQATVLKSAGVANALGATDDFWTLTGDALAAEKFRRYLLLCDASDTASVLASDDADSAAECRWDRLPANGTAIVGILTVATAAATTFTPGTTALSAAGITDTYIDGIDQYVFPFDIVTP